MAWNEHARAGDEEVPLLQLNAIIYFQEPSSSSSEFTQWKGYNLRASDAPKRRKRIEKSEVAAKRKEEAKARHEKKLEERNERLAEAAQGGEKRRRRRRRARPRRAAATRTRRGGRRGGGGGSSGMQLVAVDADKSKKEKLSAEMRAENEALLSAAAAAGKKGAKKLTTAQKLRLQQAKAMAKEDERLSKIEAKKERLAKAEAAKRAARVAPEDVRSRRVRGDDLRPIRRVLDQAAAQPGVQDPPAGRLSGRRVRTDYVPNTLNPAWEEAQKPLAYLGTRSEFERDPAHPRLRLDLTSADDLIDSPTCRSRAARLRQGGDRPLLRGGGRRRAEGAGAADEGGGGGRLKGNIEFDGLKPKPEYHQLGDIVEKLPKTTYLAVQVNHAFGLMPATPAPTPSSSCSGTAACSRRRQKYRTLSPKWGRRSTSR